MHGFESNIEHDTVCMNDMETLVEREVYSPGKISVATSVSVEHHRDFPV
jgi:hypothetical protein